VTPATTGLDLIDPRRYAEQGYPHEHWTRLRREAPVEYFEAEGYKGFWAITKHADIGGISKQPDKFLNAPRLESIELAGPPERLVSSFVGGVKHLPIRCRVAPAH